MALTRITEGVIKPNENYVVNNINSSGVTTSTNFKTGTSNLHNVGIEIAGINVLGADTPIGTGATIYDAGGAVFTGVVTATSFSGSGNIGGVDGNFSGNVTGVDATFSGNVSVGGTLTYEDVTNIDAVGLITARGGIKNTGGNISLLDRPDGNSQNLFFGTGAKAGIYHDGTNFTVINNTGHTYIGVGVANKNLMLYAQSTGNIILQRNTGHKYFEGVGSDGTAIIYHNTNEKIRTTSTGTVTTGIATVTGDVSIADKIIHTGDTNTAIRFPAGDEIQFETGGSTRLHIGSGNITQTIDTDGEGLIITAGDMKPMLTGNSNRSAENNTIFGISGKWNNTEVGRIAFEAGGDTTNKDDARIRLYTRVSGGSLTQRITISETGQFVVGTNPTVNAGNIAHIEAPSGFNNGETIVAIVGNANSAGPRLLLQNKNTGSSANSEILGTDAGGQSTGSVRFYHTDQGNNYGELALGTRNAGGPPVDRLLIDKDGNVGINDTNPSQLLTISHAANTTNGILIKNTNNSQASAIAQLELSGGDNSHARVQFECNGKYSTIRHDGNGHLDFYTNGSNKRFAIMSNGSVNIGSGQLDQTDRMLNIYGGRARISGIPNNSNSFEIYASATTGQSHGILCQAGTNSSDINSTFRNTSGTTLFRIRGDGNIGVGVDAPDRKVHIKQPGIIKLENTSTGGWLGLEFLGSSGTNNYDAYMGVLDSNGLFFIDNNSNGNDICINRIGKVFIGADATDFSDAGSFLNIKNDTYGGRIAFSNNTATAGVALMEQFAYWGSNKVAGTIISAGTDTSNKDDANMKFYTASAGVVKERIQIKSDSAILHTRDDNVGRHDVEFRNTGGIGDGNFGGIKWTQGSTGGTFLSGITIAYAGSGRPDMVFYRRDGGGTGSAETLRLDLDGKIRTHGATNIGHQGMVYIQGLSDPIADETHSNLTVRGEGGNGFACGTYEGTGNYGSWIQAGYVPNFTGGSPSAVYPLILNPNGNCVCVGNYNDASTTDAGLLRVQSRHGTNFYNDCTLSLEHYNHSNAREQKWHFISASNQGTEAKSNSKFRQMAVPYTSDSTFQTHTDQIVYAHTVGFNQYCWYKFNTRASSSPDRGGSARIAITWSTRHAAGTGYGEYSFAWTDQHNTSRVDCFLRKQHFLSYQGGSYYGWSSNPEVVVYSCTGGGSAAGFYLRLRGHGNHNGSSYDMGTIHNFHIIHNDNNAGGNNSYFEFVTNNSGGPSDASSTLGFN